MCKKVPAFSELTLFQLALSVPGHYDVLPSFIDGEPEVQVAKGFTWGCGLEILERIYQKLNNDFAELHQLVSAFWY